MAVSSTWNNLPSFIFKDKKMDFSFPGSQKEPLCMNKHPHDIVTHLSTECIQSSKDRAFYIAGVHYMFSLYSILSWALTFGSWLGLLWEQKHNKVTCWSQWKWFLWKFWIDLCKEIHAVSQPGILNRKSFPNTFTCTHAHILCLANLKVIYILPKHFWHSFSIQSLRQVHVYNDM